MGKILSLKKRNKESGLLYKRSKGEKVVFLIAFLMFTLYTLVMVFPFIWLFYT